MRHYARNIGDLAAATRGLDLLHRGAYDALLDAYYLNERPLPADARECYRLADARSPAERRAVDACLARFFVLHADGYHQKRCDAELARWAAKSACASSAVNLRWERERQAKAEIEQQKDNERSADVIRTYNERNTNVIPPTNHEPRTTSSLPSVGKKKPPTVAAAPLPDWLPADLWARFLEARVAMKARATPHGQALLLAELGKLRAQGHDPTGVLEQSISRSWRGLFPVRDPPQSSAATTKHGRRDQVAGEIWGDEHHVKPDDRAIDGTAERVA